MSMIDRLAALPALAGIPREQLAWLLENGEVVHAEDGTAYHGTGDEILGLIVLISGRFSVRVAQEGTEREIREVLAGGVTGFLPYSRMKTPRGYLVADGPVEFVSIRREDIPAMTRACYEFTGMCVQEMLERVRVFKADDKRKEKLAALGRLSAALTHELNNPASAAARAARELNAAQAEVVAASRALGAAGLGPAATEALGRLEAAASDASRPRSPIALSRLEEALESWLEARGLDPEHAYPLAECGVTVADLEDGVAAFEPAKLAAVVRSIAATCAVRALTTDIASATERIHALVAAVNKHTHMDRGGTVEAIPLAPHLADTVTLMGSKASLKGVALELSVEDDLPEVEATVSDLNQVWMHLVDNALDAVSKTGRVAIQAVRDRNNVVVSVIDDGPGIPPERQEQVFDLFYTTKDVGEGRGFGLDVVRTVVRNHHGTVDLTSEPGRTEFRVVLPAHHAS